jgi:hypothetical protein
LNNLKGNKMGTLKAKMKTDKAGNVSVEIQANCTRNELEALIIALMDSTTIVVKDED